MASYSDGSMRPITVSGKVIGTTGFDEGFDILEFSPSPLASNSAFTPLIEFVPYEDEGRFGGYTNPLECTIEISDGSLNITHEGAVVSFINLGETSPQTISNIRQDW